MEENSDYDESDEEEDEMGFYYDDVADPDVGDEKKEEDPESFEYQCLTQDKVQQVLDEEVDSARRALQVSPAVAKVLLKHHHWMIEDLQQRDIEDRNNLMVECHIIPPPPLSNVIKAEPGNGGGGGGGHSACPVCLQKYRAENLAALPCKHSFCRDCWQAHFTVHIQDGKTSDIRCMANSCNIVSTEDFILSMVTLSPVRQKYLRFMFKDHIRSHHQLSICRGTDCPIILRAKQPAPKRVTCDKCKTTFCFKCGGDYHAPTDCDIIKRWLTKCRDDSETANYISAHTKDCPKCHVCIEKNGGCNHMQCYKCKHDFCWMCLGDWRTHGSEYYECSRYKENPNIANESVLVQAREALKKYLFYFERWENHAKSLKLEEQTFQKINSRIQEKVMENSGTWIDWQYLLDAASLLAKCRYTLQYTYPYAYYMESSSRKQLFEYQQAQLEAEIENLSWKVERAETTDRGELENQMDIAEKRRIILLKDFIPVF